MDSEFPGNSRTGRDRPKPIEAEAKKIEPVVDGEVMRRRKPLGKRFLQVFGGGDTRGVVQYVLGEVAAPALRDLIVDGVTQGMERLVFGESRVVSRRPSRPGSLGGYTAYNRYSQSAPQRREERPSISRRGRAMHDFEEIILATRAEATEVIRRMDELIGQYEQVTVADLYQLLDISPTFTDEKWGWTDVRDARVEKTRSGYLLDLPRVELLD